MNDDHDDSRGAKPVDPSEVSPSIELPKIIRFEDLARCGDEVWIENQGVLYRLRQTRQGKLILTK